MRRCMGASTPPATPEKSVLINVTFGDSLKAKQQMRGEEGRTGQRNRKDCYRGAISALRCPVNTATRRRTGSKGPAEDAGGIAEVGEQ